MKNKKLFIRYKIYFVTGGLLIAIVAIVALIVIPALENLNDDVDSVQSKTLDAQIEKNKTKKLPEFKEKFEAIDSQKDKLNVLFTDDDIVQLVQELESIAGETDNEISIKVEEADEKQKIKKNKKSKTEAENNLLSTFSEKDYFKVVISLTGNYNGLLQFIYKLNNMRYYNSILAFDISSQTITQNIPNKKKTIIPQKSGISLINGTNLNNRDSFSTGKKKVLVSELTVVFYLNSSRPLN